MSYSKSIYFIPVWFDDFSLFKIDNESQMEILQNTSSVKAEKMSSKFLFGISILSLFSALIDASSYFDRINWLQPFFTALGFACVIATIFLCAVWLFRGSR